MYFEKRLKEKQLVNLDFNKLKDSISIENIIMNTTTNKYESQKLLKKNIFKLAIYTLFICVISVLCTTLIIKEKNDISIISPGDVYPGKMANELINREVIDVCIAFNGGPNNFFTLDVINKTNLISDTNKTTIEEFEKVNGKGYYNIYLGIKENKDVVIIHRISEPYETFIFESNLSYDFIDIVNDFEIQFGEEITNEFLNSNDWDDTLKKEMGGIIISFIQEENNTYKEYYSMENKDKVFVVQK